jgi:hypothetical protein
VCWRKKSNIDRMCVCEVCARKKGRVCVFVRHKKKNRKGVNVGERKVRQIDWVYVLY